MHEALGKGLADLEVFTQHTTQMAEELKKVQHQRQEEREAAARERNDVEARWLQRLRCVRLEEGPLDQAAHLG